MRSAEGRVDAKTLQRLREFLKDGGRGFKMEDAMAALRRTKEMAEGGCK